MAVRAGTKTDIFLLWDIGRSPEIEMERSGIEISTAGAERAKPGNRDGAKRNRDKHGVSRRWRSVDIYNIEGVKR